MGHRISMTFLTHKNVTSNSPDQLIQRLHSGSPLPHLPHLLPQEFSSKSLAVTFVCPSQLVPLVLQGSRPSLIHHSLDYGKPLVSRLGTCKFIVAPRLACKAECTSFFAQLNIDDSPCYSWWMSFMIRWSQCFGLLMRIVNKFSPRCADFRAASGLLVP